MNQLRRAAGKLIAGRPFVCIGHSHSENVAAAAVAAGFPLETINFWQVKNALTDTGTTVALAPEILSRLTAPVFSLIGGAVHHDIGLLVHPRPYDFVWPGRPELPLDQGAEIVPYDMIHAALRAGAQPYLRIMAAVRAAIQGPMFHMESPPIYAEESVPVGDLGWIAFFGNDRQIAPAWLRYKLWRVHSEIIRTYCDEMGIVFVAHPPAAIDSRGFLSTEFHGTPAHANRNYGALVLRQMQDLSAAPFTRTIRRLVSGQ